MDNIDDAENNAKISDSAYSNSCSNSQSRRSHSSKSTRSGSNSSGYGGKQSTSGSSNNLGEPKKDKEPNNKKLPDETADLDVVVENEVRLSEPAVEFEDSKEEIHDVEPIPVPVLAANDNDVENMDVTPELKSDNDEVTAAGSNLLASTQPNRMSGLSTVPGESDGFSCVVSMHDGVVMYTTIALTTSLGFPKDMWIGRSFIDFVHPKDRSTFAAQITNNLAGPKNANATQEKGVFQINTMSTMVCRIRRYRGLSAGFDVKDALVSFMPFLLHFFFKNIEHEDGRVTYLVIQASPFFCAFKNPHEQISKATPFVIRHAANGNIQYVDPEIVSYMGYMPQDIIDKNALLLYHPDDLRYVYQMYRTIIKEGSMAKSKPYRMLTQNGDFVKLETEWSSFINPWSSKLEFVTGKHNVLEGPGNPDIFGVANYGTPLHLYEDDDDEANLIRDNIIRLLNDVPVKLNEDIKEHMTKRCQNLASVMENLLEEHPRLDEDMQDADNNCFERDSVMLGGISPHHDYSDSMSSNVTPLSYNQLNYNETLHRYFERQHYYSYGNEDDIADEKADAEDKSGPGSSHFMTANAQNNGRHDGEASCSRDYKQMPMSRVSPDPIEEYHPIRLTESVLQKHNSKQEKELLQVCRATRSSSKGEREKATNETRLKKKEHLARCNASYQPTAICAPTVVCENQHGHGVKRPYKYMDTVNKHHCTASRQSHRRHRTHSIGSDRDIPSPINTTVAHHHWAPSPVNSNSNPFYMSIGIPQQMSMMSPVPAMPGMFPMFYAPGTTAPNMSPHTHPQPSTSNSVYNPQPHMPCMVYGQPMYSSPFMYLPTHHQHPYTPHHPTMSRPLPYTSMPYTPGLLNHGYDENPRNMSKSPARSYRQNDKRESNSEEIVDKLDEQSSYSSFYSSYFKTESGSGDDSEDARKMEDFRNARSPMGASSNFFRPNMFKNGNKKKIDPPWPDKMCVSSELVYKYQILSKSMDEVLTADKKKLEKFKQPSAVNDQLGQLYLDLQLQGVTSRLTLEEGITSSSSSGEETYVKKTKSSRKQCQYSKLMIIYEEDAPMPSPSATDTDGEQKFEDKPSTSKS